MSLSRAQFPELLVGSVPEIAPVVQEHFADNDELLLHILMADVLRFTVAAYGRGDLLLSHRCLAFIEQALLSGDAAIINAVEVSFVEGVGAFPGETPSFIASWPPALLREKTRQDRERAEHGDHRSGA
jgi:hypothetical protein